MNKERTSLSMEMGLVELFLNTGNPSRYHNERNALRSERLSGGNGNFSTTVNIDTTVD